MIFFSPVTGASSSIMVSSSLRMAAPPLMILSAVASSRRPSRIKCCLRTSGLGLLVRGSNTSATVSLLDGGNGTPAKEWLLQFLKSAQFMFSHRVNLQVVMASIILRLRKIFKWHFQPQADHHHRNRAYANFKEIFIESGQRVSGVGRREP